MNTQRILFVLTSHDKKGEKPSGFYLSEVSHPHKVLTGAGFEIDFVSPKGGKAPVDPDSMDLDDPVNAAFWNDPALRGATETTRTPDAVDPEDYAAIYYAGGHAAMWDLPDDHRLARIAARIYDAGGVVGAVCHGPAGLVNVKLKNGAWLVDGKDVAAFTNAEERDAGLAEAIPFFLADRLEERGATHHPGENWSATVKVSQRLVTGQNPASAKPAAEAMLKLLR